jgi:hypothetical protein
MAMGARLAHTPPAHRRIFGVGWALGLVVPLVWADGARAEPNVLERVETRAEGGRTVVTLHGSAAPRGGRR